MKKIVSLIAVCVVCFQISYADEASSAAPLTEGSEASDLVPLTSDTIFDALQQGQVLPGSIGRAFFANGIENREPMRVLNRVESNREAVYFFSELIDFTDQLVSHRWIFDSQVEAEVEFEVGGPRWRVWSRKTIPDNQRGLWQVDIIDQQGMIIESYPIMAH